MKKTNLSLLALAFSMGMGSLVQAQQLPLYSSYFFAPYIFNPAMSGSTGVTEATVMHRRQWQDVQGSPETSALMLNGALNKEKVGYSIYGFQDQTDIVKRFGIYGNYAYHVKLSDKSTLSFGLAAGYLNNAINLGEVNVNNPIDPVLFTTPDNRGTFDLNFGINFRYAGFQIGAAVPQLLGSPIKYSENFGGDVQYQLIRHYVFNSQYDFKIQGDRMLLSPMVVVRTAENVPVQIDAGAMFNMRKFGYVGAMYRSDYAVTANLGIHVTDQLTVGYAHDFSTYTYATALGTSNEFMLTYRFGSNSKNERLENELKKLKQDQRRQTEENEELINERLDEFENKLKKQMEANPPQQNANPGNNQGQQGNAQGNPQGQQGGNPNGQQPGQGQQGSQPNNAAAPAGGQTYNPANMANNVTPGSKGYYVVAGVFGSKANADKLMNQLNGKGIQCRSFQDQGNNFYYVYLLKFDSYAEANAAKDSRMNGSYSGDLWIKIVE